MAYPNFYKFKITDEIGQRICYTLYDAVDQTTNERVYLKVLHKRYSNNEKNIYQFLGNAQLLHGLDNPDLCKVLQYGSDLGYYYIATEALDWQPFSSLIQEEFSLSLQDMLEIFIRLGRTLRQAHLSGLIHGLLNPNNIYVNPEGSIKIDDLGLSWCVDELLRVSDEQSLYLAQYISPDYYRGADKVDGRVDIYSLGMIMIHLINGRPPFEGSSLAVLQDLHRGGRLPDVDLRLNDLPQELGAVIARAVALRPDQRFLNFKEYTTALQRVKERALKFSYATGGTYEETEVISFEPSVAQHYFEEQPEESATTSPEKAKEPARLLAGMGTILKSRNLLLSALAVIILIALVFVGSDDSPLDFGSTTSEVRTNEPTSQITSRFSRPDLAPPSAKTETTPNQAQTSVQADRDKTEPPLSAGVARAFEAPKGGQPDQPVVKPPAKTPKREPKKSQTTKNKAAATALATKAETSKPDRPRRTQRTPPNRARSAPKKDVASATPSRSVSATFQVRSENKPVEAFVFVDERFRGKTDKNGELRLTDLEPNRTYTVKVSKEGYSTVTRRFKATSGLEVLTFDLNPKLDIFGTLILDAQPKADSILVDGKLYRGATPLKITLPWGEHRVRFVNTRLNKSYEEVVNLKVGQVRRIKHNFVEAEYGKVAIALKNAAEFGFAYVYVDGKLWHGRPNTTPVEIKLPVGSHTIEVRREGFSAIPRDIIVVVQKGQTKYVSFTLTKNP